VYSLFFDRVKRDSATVAIVSDKMSKERMTWEKEDKLSRIMA
jgi:hypothetical protein